MSDLPAQPSSPSVKRIPLWLSSVIVLLALLGGGWFVWSYWNSMGPATGEVIQLEPGDVVGGGDDRGSAYVRRAIARAEAEGVRPGIGDAFTARGGDAELRVRIRGDGQPNRYDLVYARPPRLDGDVRSLITARNRITQSSNLAASLSVTREQVERLRAIRALRHDYLHVSPADMQRLQKLADARAAAAEGDRRKRADEALVAALRDVSQRSEEPTRQHLTQSAAAIAKVLTPEQIQKFRALLTAQQNR